MKNFKEIFVAFSGLVCLLICFTICGSVALAQRNEEVKKNEFGVFVGGSFDSPTIFGIGRTKNARLGIIGFHYARRFETSDKFNLKYTIDASPAVFLSYPVARLISPRTNSSRVENVRTRTYAYGAAPLGLQINFRPHKKYQPFINSSGGFLYFNKRIPQTTGTRFNFMAGLGGGLEIRLKNNRSVSLGYKYLHISNGHRGIENPGFDNNLFYIGYSFLQ